MTSGRERENGDKGEDKEPARMEIYAPDLAGVGMLDGRPADEEVGSVNARKKGMNWEEEDKTAATWGVSSDPQRDAAILMGEMQLLEMTTNPNNDREQNVVQDASDPTSASSKQIRTSAVWDADISSRPSVSHDNTHSHDDDLTSPVYAASDSPTLAGPNESAWKRLAGRAFLPHELISLIEVALMSQDEVKTIGNQLCEDDAQSFIDVIHEVPSPQLHFRCTGLLPSPIFVPPFSDLHLPLIRLWTSQIANLSSGGGAYAFYAGYAAARVCFRSRCKSHSATTDRVPRYIAAGTPMCGRASTKVAMSQ